MVTDGDAAPLIYNGAALVIGGPDGKAGAALKLDHHSWFELLPLSLAFATRRAREAAERRVAELEAELRRGRWRARRGSAGHKLAASRPDALGHAGARRAALVVVGLGHDVLTPSRRARQHADVPDQGMTRWGYQTRGLSVRVEVRPVGKSPYDGYRPVTVRVPLGDVGTR